MKFFKVTLILFTCYLSGCSLANQNLPNIETIPTQKPTNNTSIFRYYTDPVTKAQAMASVEGVFAWENGCLYLIQKDGSYMTAIFPKHPEDIVKWDEYSKTLSLNGHVFEMGDYIKSNGQYSKYYPDNDLEYEGQGAKSCLTPMLVEIGTISLKKQS